MTCQFIQQYGRLVCENCGRVLSRAKSDMLCPAFEVLDRSELAPCIHRGEIIDYRPFKCGEGFQPLFECPLRGPCTITRYKSRQPEADCLRCKMREPPVS